MAVTNFLQNVTRYMDAGLALLVNSNAFISESNKKFKNFNTTVGNLGSKIDFVLPTRYVANDTLIANFQATTQRVATLEVNKASNVSYAFSAQDQIFNADQFMDQFGRDAIAELGAGVEKDVATLAETAPYRFYGNGVDPINSYEKLADALAYFRDYGAVQTQTKGIIPLISQPSIVGTGLNQFVTDRNNKIAMSWDIGNFARCDWYTSNLLPLHVSGTTGQLQSADIKVVSISPDGTQLVVNVASLPSDAAAFKANDSLQFKDVNLRYLTFIGHTPSSSPVQIKVVANAGTVGGNATLTIYPALISTPGNPEQNIPASTPIVANMELYAFPSHRCGLIWSGSALFLGMPRLPDERPFDTIQTTDPDSGASLRYYYGAKFGMNERGSVNDVVWGKLLVPEYAMKLMFTV
jgi:hypothetical protein